jgi:prophage regulatory protein
MSAKKKSHAVPRLLSKPEVMDLTGLSYPTIWAWMRAGKFPRSRDVGGRIAWLESELAAWITDLPVKQLKRLKGDAA